MDFNCVVYVVWFSILTVEICFGIHLLVVHIKYKSRIKVAMLFLCIAIVFWCSITAFIWRMDSEVDAKQEEYESKLREPGLDRDGNLWIVVETDKYDEVYSATRGDDILNQFESFENHKDYNILGIGAIYPVQHNWCYQAKDIGKCEIYKVVDMPAGQTDKVFKYCVSVDEYGNIFYTEEIGESPWWQRVSVNSEHGIQDIDSIVVEGRNGSEIVEGELFEQFISNLIFLYGKNEACGRPDNIDDMCKVTIGNVKQNYSRNLYIDRSGCIYDVSFLDTEKEYWRVFRTSAYCDLQWLYDLIDKVD